jgi:signal transduction histidine kinase
MLLDVSSKNAKNFITAIRTLHGDLPQVTGPFLEKYPETYINDQHTYTDMASVVQMFRRYMEELGTRHPRVIEEAGELTARLWAVGLIDYAARLLPEPRLAFASTPKYNRTFNDIFEMETYEVGRTSGTLVIRYKDTHDDWFYEQCHWSRGIVACEPQLWNLPTSKYVEQTCFFTPEKISECTGLRLSTKEDTLYLEDRIVGRLVKINSEPLRQTKNPFDRLMLRKSEVKDVLTNRPERGSPTDETGFILLEDLLVEEKPLIKAGVIIGAPYCRFDFHWKTNRLSTLIGRIFSKSDRLVETDRAISDQHDYLRQQFLTLQKLNEELRVYQKGLERLVDERTSELMESRRREAHLDEQLRVRDLVRRSEDIAAGILHENKNLLGPLGNLVTRSKRLADSVKEALPHVKSSGVDTSKIEFLLGSMESSVPLADTAYRTILSGYSDFRQVYNPREEGRRDLNRDLEACVNLMIDRNYQSYILVDKSFGEIYVPQGYDSIQFNRGIFLDIIKNARDAIVAARREQGESYLGKILVTTRNVDGKTRITISDNGIGIPEGWEEKMFDKMSTTKESGTGLGLYTARFILSQNNMGRIFYERSDDPTYRTSIVVELNP